MSCVIADFGLAVSYNSLTNELFGLDNTSLMAGTVRYLAPEILLGTVDKQQFNTYERADMYCFALVLWEILSCIGILDYQLPYEKYTSRDPTIEDMKCIFA